MSFRYRVYGLSIISDIEMPELSPPENCRSAAQPEVRVRFLSPKALAEPSEWFNKCPLPSGEPFLACAKIEGGYILRYEGFCDFVVDKSGREVVCARMEPDVSMLTLRHLLLDQALPLILSLLGIEAMHATAIVTRHGACAFIGPGGAGKSTLAASFLLAGNAVMADDCLVLEARDRIFATPAYPGLRLWADAFQALNVASDRPIPVADYTPKARILGARALARFPREPQPLIRIYKVIRSERATDASAVTAPRIEAMSAREAFIELVSTAFPLDITDRAMLARQFRFFERVLAHVRVKQLLIPNDFSSLPAAREAVFADLDAE